MLVSKNQKDNSINLILKCSDQGTQETLLSQIRNIALMHPGKFLKKTNKYNWYLLVWDKSMRLT